MNEALIIVDMQKDFCKGGSLEVPGADEIVPILNKYIEKFLGKGLVIATRDWHPSNHISFKEKGGRWPKHCIQNSEGAEFHPELKLPENAIIISKGTNPKKEAYSGFEDTELEKILKENGIRKVWVGGVATEYCVKATCLDALERGFEVFLLEDACRGVNAEDERKAIEEMVRKGVKLIRIEDMD